MYLLWVESPTLPYGFVILWDNDHNPLELGVPYFQTQRYIWLNYSNLTATSLESWLVELSPYSLISG